MRLQGAARWARLGYGPLGVVAVLNGLALCGLWDLRALGPAAVGMGVLAYGFGLRHAFDLDHITAIDTVTRALRDGRRRSSGVGLYFSLGHSSVVMLFSLLVATIVRQTSPTMAWLSHTGALTGTAVSAAFLLVMGGSNLAILLRPGRLGDRAHGRTSPRPVRQAGGLLVHVLSAVFRLVRRDWQMYFVGALFGLGFDTATEVAVLGVSAAMARHGAVSLAQIMVFPVLFTAGMTLLDTLDGLAVARLYDWAVRNPGHRDRLNRALTGCGVLVAFMVSIWEWTRLWGATQGVLTASKSPGSLDFSAAGGIFTAVLLAAWLVGWLWYRRGAAACAAGPQAPSTKGAIETTDAQAPASDQMAMDADVN